MSLQPAHYPLLHPHPVSHALTHPLLAHRERMLLHSSAGRQHGELYLLFKKTDCPARRPLLLPPPPPPSRPAGSEAGRGRTRGPLPLRLQSPPCTCIERETNKHTVYTVCETIETQVSRLRDTLSLLTTGSRVGHANIHAVSHSRHVSQSVCRKAHHWGNAVLPLRAFPFHLGPDTRHRTLFQALPCSRSSTADTTAVTATCGTTSIHACTHTSNHETYGKVAGRQAGCQMP